MKTVHIKLTSAIALHGDVITAKTVLEVDENLAKNLLHRGKAVLATEADAPDAGKAQREAEEKAAREAAERAEAEAKAAQEAAEKEAAEKAAAEAEAEAKAKAEAEAKAAADAAKGGNKGKGK